MTAICGGGTSQAQPGVDPVVTLSSIAVAAALDALGFPEISLVISPLISLISYDVHDFCTKDPPPDPGLTAQDLLDATTFGDPVAGVKAIAKFQQWFASHYWYTLCECSSGSTPAPPTLSNPGPAGQDTGLPSGIPTAVCHTSSIPRISGNNPPLTGGIQNNVVYALETPDTQFMPNASANFLKMALNITCGGVGACQNGQFDILAMNHSGTVIASTGYIGWLGTGGFFQPVLQLPLDTASIGITFQGLQSYPNPMGFFGQVGFYCNGQVPGGESTPCCPPDPLLENKLNQILGLLIQFMAGSQGGPVTALTDGAVHGPLSGNGTFVLVEQCPAIRVEVQPPLPGLDHNPGSPDYYFSMGFITSYAAQNPLKGWRLVYQKQVFPLASYAEEIGYTLPAGVTVNIIEQLPAGA